MINLERFRDVHPNWDVLQDLDREQARAVLELIELGAYLDDQITRDEVEVLTEQWLQLPQVAPPPDAQGIFDRMLDSYETIQQMREDPELFDQFLDRIAGIIQDEDARYATFRLVGIVASADGFDDRELEYCFALGLKFEIELDTVEDLLRSIWETHERAVDEDLGIDRVIPRVTRESEDSGRRDMKPHPNPFSSRM